jgi:putative ABC transport system permease protein
VKFYDMTQAPQAAHEKLFIPFELTPILKIRTSGNSDGWQSCCNTYEEFLGSESVWLQFWAELPTPEKQAAFRDWIDRYVGDQKKLGRFQRPLHTKIASLTDLMVEFGAVPNTVKSMSIVSVLFLVVCSLNLVGLLLGKFLSRIPEVSVRRALGASRLQVFIQHVVECELVGVIGGLLGLALSVGMLQLIAREVPNGAEVIRLGPEMVAVSIFLSLVAGLLAGVYPAWRVCSVAPAMQLKVQ